MRYIRIDTIIEDLRTYEDYHIPNANTDEGSVSGAVQRLIRLSVDLRRDDTGGLHRHIVQCRSDRACADCTCVTTCDGYQDGVDVWIADDERRYGVPGPVRYAFWDGHKSDE